MQVMYVHMSLHPFKVSRDVTYKSVSDASKQLYRLANNKIHWTNLLNYKMKYFLPNILSSKHIASNERNGPVSSLRLAVFKVIMSSPRLSLSPFIFQFPPTKNFLEDIFAGQTERTKRTDCSIIALVGELPNATMEKAYL